MSKKPNWKKIPTVEDLKADLTSAQPSHQAHCDKIDKWLKKLAGEVQASAKPVKGRSQVQPKLIRKHAEWRYSSLEEPFLSTKDLFDIDPMTAEDVNGADENEILINYQWNTKINKVRFINEYIRTAVDEGTVIVQVGWLHEKEKRKVNVAIRLTPEQLQMKLYAMVSQGQLTQEEAIAKMQDPNEYVQWVKREQEYVKHNHPVVRICEYDRVIVDPTCEGDIEKAQFVIVPTETSISELLKDGTYDLSELFTDSTMSEIDKSKLDDDTFYSTFSSSQRDKQLNPFTFKDVARKKLTMYEYYGYWDVDGDNKTRAIKAVWIGNTLIKLEELPFPDNKLPFVLVQFMPERKSIYGTPDGKLIEDNQDILGAVLRGIIDIMGRSANGQQLLAKDFLDPINQLKYDKGENAYFNPGKDPRLSVHMQTFPEIPNSAMQMIELLNTDAESLTGVIAFNTGISGQALGNTATGVRGALDSASKRELGILRRLSQGIEQIGRKIIAMNSEFLTDEEVIRVTNREFRTIKKDDLAGDYDLRVNISTAESDNQKIEKLAFMLQTLGQNMGIDLLQLILADIAKLQKMPELAEKIAAYQPQPDPMAQKLQELEIRKLETDIEKTQADIADKYARAGENKIDAEMKAAKVDEIRANTRMKHSTADQQDQEFLQKDLGIDRQHEMNMENLKGQQTMEQSALDHLMTMKQMNAQTKNTEK